MLYTTVANVSFIISTGPLFAALLGWFVLREKIYPSTWVVMAGATMGMLLMFSEGLTSGHIIGVLIAFGLPIAFASMVVLVRRAGNVDMLPATCLATATGMITGWIFSNSLSMAPYDLFIILFMGVAQFGMGFMLITLGARYVPTAEVALLALAESILAPIWASLFLNEIPSYAVISGGVVVLICVASQAILGIKRTYRAKV